MSAPAATAVPADDTDDESRHRQLTVLAGWRRFVDEEPAPPELLPDPQWRRLDGAGRLSYDEARLNHHSRLLVVATPVIRKVITEGRRLSYLNRNADSGRCGLILSGPARTGKTTAITQLGKTLEVIHRQRHPHAGNDIPVIYITVPPAATAKMIAVEFARFLGLPLRTRANVTDIADAVCQVLVDARTDLVLVDEIHNLNHGTPAGEDLSDHLKYFTEHLPATFIYAGIDVERCGVFTGTRGRQLAGRLPEELLLRPGCAGVQFIETTVSPSNHASRRVFERFADVHSATWHEEAFLTPAHFGAESHEEEVLFRIGPLAR